jgi:hypothetical protein
MCEVASYFPLFQAHIAGTQDNSLCNDCSDLCLHILGRSKRDFRDGLLFVKCFRFEVARLRSTHNAKRSFQPIISSVTRAIALACKALRWGLDGLFTNDFNFDLHA